jgi:hypothetical protein
MVGTTSVLRYLERVQRAAARAFASRDWQAFERLKVRESHSRFDERGGAAAVRRSRAVWQFVRAIRPDWPSETARARDLANHIVLKHRLDQAARAFAVR